MYVPTSSLPVVFLSNRRSSQCASLSLVCVKRLEKIEEKTQSVLILFLSLRLEHCFDFLSQCVLWSGMRIFGQLTELILCSGMGIVLGSADFRDFLIDFEREKKNSEEKKFDYGTRRDPTFFLFYSIAEAIMFFKVEHCRCDLFFRSRTCVVRYFIHSKDRLLRGVAIVHGTCRGLL